MSCNVEVTYDPSVTGQDNTTLELSFANGLGVTAAIDVVEMTGLAIASEPVPALLVADVELNFGTLDLTELPAIINTSLEITNSSVAPNTQTATGLTLTTSGVFAIEASQCPEVAAGATVVCEVTLSFNATSNGEFSASLLLNYDGGTAITADSSADIGSVVGTVISGGVFSFASESFSVPESAGQTEIPILRSNGSDGAQTVVVSITPQSASRPLDFDLLAIDGVSISGENQASVEFTNGETTKLLRIQINSDNELEEPETLAVAITDTPSIQIAGNAEAVVTIIDSSDAGELTISSDSTSVDESAGEITIDVSRSSSTGSGDVAGEVILAWTVTDGSATVGEDLPAQSGVVEWLIDESGNAATGVRAISVGGIVADSLIEGTETFNLSFSASGSAADRIVLPDTLTISIVDSTAVVPVELSLTSGGSVTVVENTAGVVQIEVARSGDSQSEVTLPYSIGGADDTADEEDHEATDGALFWPAGDTDSRFIEVPIVDDTVSELTEILTINFGELPNPASTLWPSTLTAPDLPAPPSVQHPPGLTLTIADDDALLLSDESDSALILLQVVSDQEVRAVNPPVLLAPFEVRAVQVTTPELPQCAGTDVDALVASGCTQPVAGAEVNWTVFPDPDGRPGEVAEFVTSDGATQSSTVNTLANDEGIASIQTNVLRRGFIGIRATPILNVVSSKTVAQPVRGIRAIAVPEVPSGIGDVVFTIRGGLQTTIGFSVNQARLGFAIDGICDALDSGDIPAATSPEEESLFTLCDLENESETEILGAMDALLPEEYFTIADASVDLADLQVSNVYSRLLAIRSRQLRGSAAKIDLSGLSLKLFGESIPSIVPDTAVNSALNYVRSYGSSDTQNDEHNDGRASGGSSGSSYISPWGFFANGSIAIGEADSTETEVGQDFNTRGLTAGVDYMINDNTVVGAALGVTRHTSDFRGQRGSNDLDGTYLSIFASRFNPKGGYLDAIVEVGNNQYDLSRQINLDITNPEIGSSLQSTDELQFADGETSANSFALTIGAGVDKEFKGYQLGPYGRLSFTRAEVDGFSESARFQDRAGIGYVLSIQDYSIRSTRLALGGQVSKTLNTKRGVFLPQLRIEAEFENEDQPDSITSSFRFDPTDSEFTIDGDENDSFVVNYSFGGSAVFKNGKSGFLFYEGQAAHETVTQHRLKGGFRLEF